MSKQRFYFTTAIPYVNGSPHVGHALELVQADVLARHRRLLGDEVRFLTGTDDNAVKNAEAARAARVPVAEYVAAQAARFAELREPLELSNDDFIRTGVDLRHRVGVERLWRACAAAGDLYLRDYEGLYCTGCEAFLAEAELAEGLCPEHGTRPEPISEQNWFFRLSRHQARLIDEIESGRLRIEPEQRRNEVLSFIRAGLLDFSVSRSRERTYGWGLPVPDDPSQVIYVWFDALANYITALDYGTGGELYRGWWEQSTARVHVIGKGVTRFHAVYWPAILLSAGEPLPTAILVHDYLTVDGQKISKSVGTAAEPTELVRRYSADGLRWWFVRDVPRSGDADFRSDLVAARVNELANVLGNLVNRTIALTGEGGQGHGVSDVAPDLEAALAATRRDVTAALDRFDLRAAADAVWRVVIEANRTISAIRPWELAERARAGDSVAAERLEAVLSLLRHTCRSLALELRPFLPEAAGRIERALDLSDRELGRELFRKVERRG